MSQLKKMAVAVPLVLIMTSSPIVALTQTAPVQAAPPTNGATLQAPSAVQQTRAILVPAGTAVTVHVVGTLNSGSAREGDTFPIQAADDVVVNDMVIIRKGAGGQGTVINADGAGGNGHSGSLSFSLDYIYSVDGGKIQLSQAPQKQAEEDRKGASSTATIIGFATFGLGGLFGHNLARGRQKVLDEKTILNAFVADNVHVDTSIASSDRFDK